jgi:hypothetical protein
VQHGDEKPLSAFNSTSCFTLKGVKIKPSGFEESRVTPISSLYFGRYREEKKRPDGAIADLEYNYWPMPEARHTFSRREVCVVKATTLVCVTMGKKHWKDS